MRALFLFPLLILVLSATGANGDARVLGRAEVIDGDTLEIGVVRIRLNGIDAPEAGQTCLRASGRSWQCGSAATNRLAELVEGREIECRARDRNVYGRIIADCWQHRTYVNQRLVAEASPGPSSATAMRFSGIEVDDAIEIAEKIGI